MSTWLPPGAASPGPALAGGGADRRPAARGISFADLGAALPDFAIAATFVITWVAPTALGDLMVTRLLMVMLLEFIVVHSSAFMGTVVVSDGPRGAKAVAILGLGALYSLFAGAFSLAFHSWWPILAFWALTLNRLLGVLIGQAPEGREKAAVMAGWGIGAASYLGFTFLTLFIPIPRLGITPEVVSAQHFTSSGIWIDQPWRVMAFGTLYFFTIACTELFAGRMFAKPAP